MSTQYNQQCPVFIEGTGFLVTSPFGYRVLNGVGQGHQGIDITRWDGYSALASIIAFDNGKVIAYNNSVPGPDYVNPNNSAGNYVCIDHGNGWVTKYFHLQYNSLPQGLYWGKPITKGTYIGYMGNTGNSYGAHLHFQMEKDKVPVDPLPYLLGQESIRKVEEKPWVDQASDWAKDDVDWAVTNGILQGVGGDNYNLQGKVTREQMCAFMHRLYDMIKAGK